MGCHVAGVYNNDVILSINLKEIRAYEYPNPKFILPSLNQTSLCPLQKMVRTG